MSEPLSLERFALRNVEGLDNGRKTGAGAYGVVREVSVTFDSGVKITCIAKRLHDILNNEQVSERERTAIGEKFRDECITLSKLKHPNIVHFLGVSFGTTNDDLSLIMEQLDTDLYKFVSAAQLIPLPIQLSILLDVGYGLLYLHTGFSPPIIHRDLRASNILISQKCEVRAKIADLGVTKLMDRAKMSNLPGTQHYTAPEVLYSDNPVYGTELDVFSFGHLTLCTAAQKVQGIVQDIEHLDVRESIRSRKWRGKLQLLKRRRAVDVLERMNHPLVQLLLRCLRDSPHERPTTGEIVDELQSLCINHPKGIQDTLSATEEGKSRLRVSEEDKASLAQLCQDQKSHLKILADEAQQLKKENVRLQKVVEQLKLKQTPSAVKEHREGIFEKKAAEFEREVDTLRRENRGLYNENVRLLRLLFHPPVKLSGLTQARNSSRAAQQQDLSQSAPQSIPCEFRRTVAMSKSLEPRQPASRPARKQEPAHATALKSIRPPVPLPRRQTSLSENIGRRPHKQPQLLHSLSADDQKAALNGVNMTGDHGLTQNLESSRRVLGGSQHRARSECDAEEYYNVADLVSRSVPGVSSPKACFEPGAHEYYNVADIVTRLQARRIQQDKQLMPEASALEGFAVNPSSSTPASVHVSSSRTTEGQDEYIDMSRSAFILRSGRGNM